MKMNTYRAMMVSCLGLDKRDRPLMKMKNVGLLLVSVMLAMSVQAVPYYWDGGTSDISGNGNGVSAGGSGTWNTTIKNWDIGATAQTNWPALPNSHQAYFGGSGGTVTFGANMGATGWYPNSLNVTAGNYIFDQAGYDVSWRGTGLTISNGATLVLTNGTVTFVSAGITVTGANALKIYSKVTGAAVFSKGGAGDIYLYNNTNDFTGKLSGANGYSVYFTSIKSNGVASAVGTGTTLETGYNNTMVYIGTGDSTDRTFSLVGEGNDNLKNDGSGALVWGGPFTNSKSGASTLTFGGYNTATSEFRSVLTNSTGGAVLSVAKADAGTWMLTAANTYSGGTSISGGTLVFSKTNAIPVSGTVAVGNGGTLGIFLGGDGEFTSAKSGAGTLGGLLAGVGGQGAPVTYSGDIKLRVDTRNATAGQTNTSNIANLGTSLALIKAGAGELTLSGTNTYTGITTIEGGTLRFVNYMDLSTLIGSSTLQINNGATLDIYSSVGGANRTVLNNKTWSFGNTGGGTINFNMGSHLFQGGSTHLFTTSGGTQNTISSSNGGFMNMQNAGTVTFNVAEGPDPVDLLLSAIFNNGFIIKNGTGTLSIRGTHGGSFAITINAGTLDVGGSSSLAGGIFTAAITNNALFSYSSSANQTLGGIMSGTGALLKTGTGMLTLTNSNTYSGTTVVTNGVLKLTHAQGLSTGTAVILTNTPNAKIELSFSGTVTVKSLTVNGELMTRNRLYNVNNLPNAFSGLETGYLYTLEGIPPKGTMIRVL